MCGGGQDPHGGGHKAAPLHTYSRSIHTTKHFRYSALKTADPESYPHHSIVVVIKSNEEKNEKKNKNKK